MSRVKLLSLTLALLGATLPSAALAQQPITFTMPSQGFAYVGLRGSTVHVGFTTDNITCTWTRLSNADFFDRDTTIMGSSGHDIIYVAATTLFPCGVTLQPVKASVHSRELWIDGWAGNDAIFSAQQADVFGGAGNDTIQCEHNLGVLTVLSGGSGNDVVYTREAMSVVSGGAGDDVVCMRNPGQNVRSIDGGTHINGDRRCGTGTTQLGFETSGCAYPCF